MYGLCHRLYARSNNNNNNNNNNKKTKTKKQKQKKITLKHFTIYGVLPVLA